MSEVAPQTPTPVTAQAPEVKWGGAVKGPTLAVDITGSSETVKREQQGIAKITGNTLETKQSDAVKLQQENFQGKNLDQERTPNNLITPELKQKLDAAEAAKKRNSELSKRLGGFLTRENSRKGLLELANFQLVSESIKSSTAQPVTESPSTPAKTTDSRAGNPLINARRNENAQPKTADEAKTQQKSPDAAPQKRQPEQRRERDNHTELPDHFKLDTKKSDPNFVLQRPEPGPFDLVDKKGKIAQGTESPDKRFKLQGGDYSLVDKDGNLIDSPRKQRNQNSPIQTQESTQPQNTSETKRKMSEEDRYYHNRVEEWNNMHPEPSDKESLAHAGWENQRKIAMRNFQDMALKHRLERKYEKTINPHPGKKASREEITTWMNKKNEYVNKEFYNVLQSRALAENKTSETVTDSSTGPTETLAPAPAGTEKTPPPKSPTAPQPVSSQAAPVATTEAPSTATAPAERPVTPKKESDDKKGKSPSVEASQGSSSTTSAESSGTHKEKEDKGEKPKTAETAKPAESRENQERDSRMKAYIKEFMNEWKEKNPEPKNEHSPAYDRWATDRAYAYENAKIDAKVHEALVEWQNSESGKKPESDSDEFDEWFISREEKRQELLKKFESDRKLPKRNEQPQPTASFTELSKYITKPEVMQSIIDLKSATPQQASEIISNLNTIHRGLGETVMSFNVIFSQQEKKDMTEEEKKALAKKTAEQLAARSKS